MKTLGMKISECRKKLGMTQEELAVKFNVSAQAVSKWENDLSIPDVPLLVEMSNFFHISLDQLLKAEEVMDTPAIVPQELRKPANEMMLRIIVNSSDGDKVRVNLPLMLVKSAIQLGMAMPQVTGNKALEGIDMEMLMQMVDQGMVGKLVEVESSDGDFIEIVVE